jgi:hypothetical protein
VLTREAFEDCFASRNFDEAEDGQGEQDQNDVREPGVKGGQMKTLRHPVSVEELEDIEVEKIEAVAAFANKKKGPPGEDGRDGMWATEAEDEGREDGGHEAAVYEEVGSVENKGIEEDRN